MRSSTWATSVGARSTAQALMSWLVLRRVTWGESPRAARRAGRSSVATGSRRPCATARLPASPSPRLAASSRRTSSSSSIGVQISTRPDAARSSVGIRSLCPSSSSIQTASAAAWTAMTARKPDVARISSKRRDAQRLITTQASRTMTCSGRAVKSRRGREERATGRRLRGRRGGRCAASGRGALRTAFRRRARLAPGRACDARRPGCPGGGRGG